MEQRKNFIEYFFKAIKNCRYAILKDIYPDIYNLPESADIDLVVDRQDLYRILSIIRKGEHISKIRTERKSFASYVKIFFEDLSYLEIDLIHRFDRKGITYLSVSEVLTQPLTNKQGLKAAQLHHQFNYIILFYMLNRYDVPQRYRDYFAALSQEERRTIFSYITSKYNVHINTLDDLYNYHNRHRKKLLQKINSDKSNNTMKYLNSRIHYYFDLIKSPFNEKGMVITFSGVDGAGKSTVLETIKSQLESKYRKPVKVLRHRPSLLPILSSVKHGKKAAEQKAASSLPRKGTNNNFFSSLLRFSYYYTDYLAGRFYVYYKYKARGITVLYDRYYFDFIVDGRRSNIALHPSIIKLGYALVSKPEVNFFLYAPENEILKRKQELNESDIRTMTDGYMHLFIDLSTKYKRQQYITLNNENLDKTVDTVMKHIISAQ